MKKIVRIGSALPWHGAKRRADIFCKIEIEDGKFSISGVIGPRPSGNATGGCGQIDMEFAHRDPADDDKRTRNLIKPDEIKFAPGWNADLWLGFLDIWKEWHLNDMQAGCEHQQMLPEFQSRDLELTKAEVDYHQHEELVKAAGVTVKMAYGDDVAFYEDLRSKVAYWPKEGNVPRHAAGVSLFKGYKLGPSAAVLRILLDLGLKPFHPIYMDEETVRQQAKKYRKYVQPDDVVAAIKFSKETKRSNWVRVGEHPLGLLQKPCPVCGYKYGTAWHKRALPQSVIDFVAALPDTDKSPAWV